MQGAVVSKADEKGQKCLFNLDTSLFWLCFAVWGDKQREVPANLLLHLISISIFISLYMILQS